jgi:hypothetical protein
VIDDGPGAPPDIAEHLFDPFVSSKRQGAGSASRWSRSWSPIRAAWSNMRAKDRPERTVFRMLLPARAEQRMNGARTRPRRRRRCRDPHGRARGIAPRGPYRRNRAAASPICAGHLAPSGRTCWSPTSCCPTATGSMHRRRLIAEYPAAGHRAVGAEHLHHRGARDRAGRVRLSAQAVRSRRAGARGRRRIGRRPRQPTGKRPDEARASLPLIGRSPAMQEVYRIDRARRFERPDRADLGRIGHRQGTGRARDPRFRPAPPRALRRRQHGRDPARADRGELFGHERGAFTGAAGAHRRQVRAGAGRHAVPRRDRRHADGSADPAAARAPVGRIHARRRRAHDPGRCAHHRRHQPGSARSSARASFARICSTGSTSCRCAAGAARARIRTLALLARHFLDRAAEAACRASSSIPPRSRGSSSMTGRAMSASSKI